MTPIQREWTIGEYTACFEPPDLLRVKYKGACTLREAKEMLEVCRELGTVRPFFILGDMEEVGVVDAEARQYFTEHFQTQWLLGIVTYKTRLLSKAILMGLRLAIAMTRGEDRFLLGKIHFAATRESAEALVAQLRTLP